MNKRWVEEDGAHILYFTPFYEELEIARITPDEDGDWCYSSPETKAEFDYLYVKTLDQAKNKVECMIAEHYQDEINYYQELFDKFDEE